MRYGIYFDWENIWIQHIRLSFPGLPRLGRTVPPGVPRTTFTPIIRNALMEFPDVVWGLISSRFGGPPDLKYAAAVWNGLEYAQPPQANIQNKLDSMGIQSIIPSCLPKHSKDNRHEIKNAADREMLIKILDDVHSAAMASLDAIVLASGDHFFARAITYIKEKTGKDVHVLSFAGSTSSVTRDVLRAAGREDNLFLIEKHPLYVEHCKKCHALDAVMLHRSTNPVPISEMIKKTAILKRHSTKMKFVRPDIFETWIVGWLQYWNDMGITVTLTYKDVMQLLKSEKIISVSYKNIEGRRQLTADLLLGEPFIASTIEELRQSEPIFIAKYQVPPGATI
jgi:hypothetical protein